MKKIIGIILASLTIAPVAQAATLVYSGVMQSLNGPATSPSAASTTSYTMDLDQNSGLQTIGAGGDIIGAQIIYASASIPSITFKDGSVSTFTITVTSTQGVVGLKASNTITVSNNGALNAHTASATINISSNSTAALNLSSMTIVTNDHSIPVIGGTDYAVGASSNATAINLAAYLNYVGIGDFTAAVNPVGGSTVTITTTKTKSKLNNWTITSSTVALTVSSPFAGGADSASFTLNGVVFLNGGQWFVDPVFSSNTAVSIANAITASGGYGVVAATTSSTIVTLTANSVGANGNAYTLTSSTGALAVGTFTGGQNNASILIGNTILTNSVDWALPLLSSTTANLATSIAASINANGTLSPLWTAVANGSVITTTADIVGVGSTIATSTQTALTISPFTSSSPVTGVAIGTSFGGSVSNYVINTPTITVSGHNLTTGYPVWFSTGSAVGLSPLVVNTTYYAIRIDANNFALALTSTGAAAGLPIIFTSSQTKTAADSFTLNATALTGTPVFQLQSSNDGVNFNAVTAGENGSSIASQTFASPYTAGSTTWAIGTFPWRYLRLLYSGPTTGGTNFTFYVNQKTSSTAR